jgi:transcriptional regulator GlxA family with amidase domain
MNEPRSALDAVTEELEAPRIESLRTRPGAAIDDPVIRHLGGALLAAVELPERANRLFLDHVAMALHVHLASAYGQTILPQPLKRGGLTPAQEGRVEEMLLARLDGSLSLDELAAACGLSRSHFARAFKASFGQPPHRRLRAHRVERARELVLHSKLSLAEIAIQSGFSSQSHFTTVFTRSLGVSPGALRRSRRS